MTTKVTETGRDDNSPLAILRRPFPANQISKLPKESKAQADQRKADRNSAISCKVCGGWHHKNAVHLDYVGHAALTDRLLDADPKWNWEPLAVDDAGLPAFDRHGGLWIKLTVDGVTRLGYGAADGKTGGDAIKEIIGDALRNSGMRFGAALDLWHKGDLHLEGDNDADATTHEVAPRQQQRTTPATTEPEGGWGDWTRAQIVKIAGAATEENLDDIVDGFRESAAALKAHDAAMYADLVKANRDRRALLADLPA